MATTGTKLSQQPRPQGQTGTKLSPHSKKHLFQPIRGEQGENCHGPDANNPSRENLFPQTTTHQPRSAHAPVQNSPSNPHLKTKPVQNSPSIPHLKTKPEQNSPSTRRVRPQPVQNSPSTGKTAHFSPSSASREKIVTVQTQTTRAGRIFSRRPPPTTHAAHTPRYKTLPATPTSRPNRYKTLPALPDADTHAQSRMQFHNRPDPRVLKSVGISRICHHGPKDSLGNCMRNCRASRKTAHKTGPVIIHRPRLVSVSSISANASDYQARTERS